MKQTTVYSSATIEDNMLVLSLQTRFKASHSETRVMLDKITSVTHSVVLGKKSIALLVMGLIFLILGAILAIATPIGIFGIIISLVGFVFIIVAMCLRDHGITICSGGDVNATCLGRTQTDEFYQHLCAVLKANQRSANRNATNI